jgi:hypothetical protein
MMQKSTTFTAIFRVKKYYFHYDFACKKVPLSLRYAKNNFFTCLYFSNDVHTYSLTSVPRHLIIL